MGEESPKPASTPTGAVFLSYASEDVESAARIAYGLRAAGIEVWFDQSELRGGDAWDHRIREQIHNCRLFIAVVSAHSEQRDEGYFRLEWKLAIDRSHLMSAKKAFIVPVVIDGTSERSASVPDKFHELQWMRLSGGDPNPAFVERILRLLSSTAAAKPAAHAAELPAAPAPLARVSVIPALAFRRLALVVVSIGVLAIGYWVLNRVVLSKHAVPAAAAKGPSTSSPSSIAVLPLVNESGDPDQQYFSDGLSEDLITALGQIPGLKVVGRVSSFRFRDSKEDSAAIGAKLGVTHLVEGSVRRAGDVVRVSAELINAADGTMQWSERYDRPYKNLFALQDELTRAVAGALKTKLLISSGSREQSDRPPSGNLEAYAALLQGRFYLTDFYSEANCRKAIDQFSASTRLDPDYALAWAELGRAWMILSYGHLSGTRAQAAYAQARTAVDRALALSPNLAPAHVERASMFSGVEFDQQRALAEFRRAVQLAPDDAYARRALGLQLAYMGEVEQGVELMREALASDPLNVLYLNTLGYWLPVLGHLDDGERMSRKVMELNPGSVDALYNLSYIEVLRGDARAALAAAESVPQGLNRTAALALARQIGPDRAAADATLKTLIDGSGDDSAYQIAVVYALRNDREKAFEWLDRAWKKRDHGLVGLYADPFLKRFRSDPRFADLCRKVGLPVPEQSAERNS
ncbi:MAG: TIR domain-containing protein [Gammaproteobacteria bacterium]|nr:TIR domain-containing protein [Gammaproteobacteria bacterium]